MVSSSGLKLPLIDFSGAIEPGTAAWADVRDSVRKALEEYGCFEARFDRVSLEQRDAMLAKLKELFDLPLQIKQQNVSSKPFHGYVGQYPQVPLFESMGIDNAVELQKVEELAHTLWPEGHHDFSITLQSYSEKLSYLDKITRQMILESLDVEKYIEEHLNSTNYLLRVMKYKNPETHDTKLGLNAHTDKNFVTILYQNQVEGLQIQTKAGEWIDFKPSPESFIVMIGDSLIAWANGRLHSPKHRVMMTGNETRYSAGLFSVPNSGYIIKAPEELVDKEHPLLFKPFDHIQFMEFYYTPEGQRVESALKAYCGA